MSKTVYRYFFDLIDGQQSWLNRMAGRGWRLVSCAQLAYRFERCGPGEYEYAVELVGHRPWAEAEDYRALIEETGLRTLIKSANPNWSVGKVRWRPWAAKGGRLATSPGGFNRELLIVEKKADGKPLALHTGRESRLAQYRYVARAYLWAALLPLAGLAATTLAEREETAALWAIRGGCLLLSLLWLIPGLRYLARAIELRKEGKINE